MIPQGFDTEIEILSDISTTRTYRVADYKIQGFTDELGALEQSIFKILNTEKYEHPIYSFDYGIEFESLIGKDPSYVRAELKRRIRECLMKDDRVQDVGSFRFTGSGDEVLCEFDVQSIYGGLTVQQEVNV